MKTCILCGAWNYSNAVRCSNCNLELEYSRLNKIGKIVFNWHEEPGTEPRSSSAEYPGIKVDNRPNLPYIPVAPRATLDSYDKLKVLEQIGELHARFIRLAEEALNCHDFSRFNFYHHVCTTLFRTTQTQFELNENVD